MTGHLLRAALGAAIAIMRALLIVAMASPPLYASQNNLYNPTSGTLSGLTMVQNYNNALDSLNTCNSGGSAPTNQLSGSPSLGNCWINATTNPYPVQRFDGASWLTPYWLDTVNHWTIVKIGGGTASVASASTTDICTGVPQAYVTITGTTTITSLGSACNPGHVKFVTFSGALTLTYNSSSMILPTGGNITTAAGDTAVAVVTSAGAGNWQIVAYQRASGAALSSAGLSIGASALAASALASFEQPINAQINASVTSGQLAVALVGVNGNALSSTNPVLMGFRSQTQNNGTNILATLTTTFSITLGTAASLGCPTATACRVWFTAICQTEAAGACTSVLPGLSVQAASGSCYPLNEAGLYPSTGSGTTSGGVTSGTTLGTIQTTAASLTNKAIKILGYVEATWTSGTGWSIATSNNTQLFSPGTKKPCDIVQTLYNQASGSLPSQAITPTSAINQIKIHASVQIAQTVTSATTYSNIVKLERGSTVLSQHNQTITTATSSGFYDTMHPFDYIDNPATTSSTTYSLNDSSSTPNTPSVNNDAEMILEEIMSALDPTSAPANDNIPPGVLALTG